MEKYIDVSGCMKASTLPSGQERQIEARALGTTTYGEKNSTEGANGMGNKI